jgi:hypothetical protein
VRAEPRLDLRSIDSLTSHIDLLPTLLGLAGLNPEPLRRQLAQNHSESPPGLKLYVVTTTTLCLTSIAYPVPSSAGLYHSPTRGLIDVMNANRLARKRSLWFDTAAPCPAARPIHSNGMSGASLPTSGAPSGSCPPCG